MIYTDQGRHFVGVSSDIGSEKFVADQALLIFVKTVTTGALFCRDSQNVFRAIFLRIYLLLGVILHG